MNSDTKEKLMQLCREAIDTNACGCEDEFGAMIEAAFADWELIDTRYHTIIDRLLLKRMPKRKCDAYAVVCNDGTGAIYNGYETFSCDEVCEFGPGFDTATAAMQAWLDVNEKPAWNWPVPTDADKGKAAYCRDQKQGGWNGPYILLGIVEYSMPFVVCDVTLQGWRYAVLADPNNPCSPPPADLVLGKEGKAAGGNNG